MNVRHDPKGDRRSTSTGCPRARSSARCGVIRPRGRRVCLGLGDCDRVLTWDAGTRIKVPTTGGRILSPIRDQVPNIYTGFRYRPSLSLCHLAIVLLSAVPDQSTLRSFEGQEPDAHEGIVDTSDEIRDTGVIYARVGTVKQAEDGVSLDLRIEILREVAGQEDIRFECSPIPDEGKTGTSFERDGIQEVFQHAKKDRVAYLLVQDIDQIGRAAAETLFYSSPPNEVRSNAGNAHGE